MAANGRDAAVVIVGAGIAGGALATVLARGGIAVLLLEKTLAHTDRVRGEWLAPWGVAETQRLGIYDLLRDAGGNHAVRHIEYDEITPPEDARARTLDLSTLLPGVPGPMCLGHPTMCDLLDGAATAAGATLLRGVEGVTVIPGDPPQVTFRHDGVEHTLRPRLVVGADGRNSVVRRQVGITEHQDPTHHFMAGLLVDGLDDWPTDLQTVGTEGDVNFLVFPQGQGRARLYLCVAREQVGRITGPEGARAFVEAFRLRCVPESASFATARPAGPCNAFPNHDTWTDGPVAPGVVLIADAAGHNDPLIGQGLSIAFRDVRLLGALLLAERDWRPPRLAPYVEERAERMRRLRWSAQVLSVMECEFGPDARQRRARALARMADDQILWTPKLAAFAGPEVPPAEGFTDAVRDRLLEP